MSRIVNIKYRCCGYNFDAAVDCDWELHCYDERRNDVTPIELYNLDEDWDIRMVYQKNRNDQNKPECAMNHTCVDWNNLTKETRKWVREMRKK
jgi:hypothetical protein